ncbi:AAA family ATPase [Streptacidiphilus sp. PAMC 29251]
MTGREQELQAFQAAWDAGCSAAVLSGAGGVGKSRLAEECLLRATSAEDKVVRVTGTPAVSVPLGSIAHLIPSGVDLSEPVTGFEAVGRAMRREALGHQYVVFVDDLQYLDSVSLSLLRALLDGGVIRVIATRRSGDDDLTVGQALTSEDGMCTIELAPLREPVVDDLLRAVLGGAVARPTVSRLFRASGGNALYLRELVHAALGDKSLTNDGEIWRLAEAATPTTPQLRELIEARLSRVPSEAREVLELLAYCEPVSEAIVSGMASPKLVDSLAEAGLVRTAEDGRRTLVTLAHPLYAEQLRAGVSVLRRRRILTEHLKRIQATGARRSDDPLQIATWQLLAGSTADPALLLQAATLARYVNDYQRVVDLLRALPEEHRTHSSYLLLGEALLQTGQWRQADTVLTLAENHSTSEKERVTATLARTWNLFWMAAEEQEAMEVNAVSLSSVVDPQALITLRVNEASMRTLLGQPQYGLEVLSALELDPQWTPGFNEASVVAMSKSMGLALVGRGDEAISWAEHAYNVQSEKDREELGPPLASQLIPMIFALSDQGRLDEARDIAEEVLAETATSQNSLTWMWAACYRGRTEWLAGHIRSARHWYAEAVAHAEADDRIRPLIPALAGLAASAAVLGDEAAAGSALAKLVGHTTVGLSTGEERLGQAWLCAAQGKVAEARAILIEAAASAKAVGHTTSEMLLLTDVARLGGAKDVVQRMVALAATCDGPWHSVGPGLPLPCPTTIRRISLLSPTIWIFSVLI